MQECIETYVFKAPGSKIRLCRDMATGSHDLGVATLENGCFLYFLYSFQFVFYTFLYIT